MQPLHPQLTDLVPRCLGEFGEEFFDLGCHFGGDEVFGSVDGDHAFFDGGEELDEAFDSYSGGLLDVAGYRDRGEHDGEVCFDFLAVSVVDRACS